MIFADFASFFHTKEMTMRVSRRSCASLKAMVACAVLLTSLTMTACQTSGGREFSKSGLATESVIELRAQLVAARDQISQNIDAGNALANSGATLPKVFVVYVKETDETRDAANDAARRSASLRMSAAKYINTWQAQMNKLSRAEVNTSRTEVSDVVRKHFETIRDKAAEVKGAYTPFLNNLTDLEVYLEQDLTMRGVNAAKPTITQMKDSGQSLIASLNGFITSLDAMVADAADMQPTDSIRHSDTDYSSTDNEVK